MQPNVILTISLLDTPYIIDALSLARRSTIPGTDRNRALRRTALRLEAAIREAEADERERNGKVLDLREKGQGA